jgi:cell division septal protein FtsQ
MSRLKPSALRRPPARDARARLATFRDVCLRALTPLSALLALGIVALLLERGVSALYAQPVAHIAVSGKLDSRYRDAVRETVAGHIDRGLLGLDLLRPLELQPLSLEEDPFGQLNVVFDSGIELALGDRDFAARMDDFLTLWRRELRDDRARVLRVDMRYETGAAVAFREQPQLAGLAAESGEG